MKFFNYRQNNSGGSFILDEDIRIQVIVEAESAEEADRLAESHGVYFDGCATGYDCSCCGDRWSESWDDGTDVPQHYGDPYVDEVEDYNDAIAVVYYKDGTRKYFTFKGSYSLEWL